MITIRSKVCIEMALIQAKDKINRLARYELEESPLYYLEDEELPKWMLDMFKTKHGRHWDYQLRKIQNPPFQTLEDANRARAIAAHLHQPNPTGLSLVHVDGDKDMGSDPEYYGFKPVPSDTKPRFRDFRSRAGDAMGQYFVYCDPYGGE